MFSELMRVLSKSFWALPTSWLFTASLQKYLTNPSKTVCRISMGVSVCGSRPEAICYPKLHDTEHQILPRIRHTGLRIFAGSVALKTSRARCFSGLLDFSL